MGENSTLTATSEAIFWVKGVRQSVVMMNNPSTTDHNQQLVVQFSNLGNDDIIIPGTLSHTFMSSLTSTDTNWTMVQNLGHAMVRWCQLMIAMSSTAIRTSGWLNMREQIPSSRALTISPGEMSPRSGLRLGIRMRLWPWTKPLLSDGLGHRQCTCFLQHW